MMNEVNEAGTVINFGKMNPEPTTEDGQAVEQTNADGQQLRLPACPPGRFPESNVDEAQQAEVGEA